MRAIVDLDPTVLFIFLASSFIDKPSGLPMLNTSPTAFLSRESNIVAFTVSFMANMVLQRHITILLCGGIAVAFVGFLDDWKGVPASLKLLIQICVVLVLAYEGIVLDLFPIRTTWGFWLNLLFTVIWIVGITNAMNFFDGMDGLATGLGAIMATFIGIVAFQTNQPFMGWMAIAILGSCLGFFPYNFRLKHPAIIFLGDGGSTFLGFMLAGLAVEGYWSDMNRIVSFANPVLIFWVLIFDMIYITVERVISGKVRTVKEWIDYVGTDHLHHRLYVLLGNKWKAVLTIFLFSMILGLSSIALRNARMIDSILLVAQASLISIIFSVLEYVGRRNNHSPK